MEALSETCYTNSVWLYQKKNQTNKEKLLLSITFIIVVVCSCIHNILNLCT